MCCRWRVRRASIPKRGARIVRSTSSAGRPRNVARTNTGTSLLRKLLGQLDPFAVRRKLSVCLPMRPGVQRLAHLLERDSEIEVRVGVEGIEPQRFAVA